MLLVDPTVAAREWNRVVEEIDRIVKRNEATVLQVSKWGERKLCYPVRRSNRGTYVLAYFAAPPGALTKIKADFQLSEIVLRSLLVAHEGELRKDPPKDFETAGPLPPKMDRGGDRGPRPEFGGGDRGVPRPEFGGGEHREPRL
jgi:small subunit ribosomal protein S6